MDNHQEGFSIAQKAGVLCGENWGKALVQYVLLPTRTKAKGENWQLSTQLSTPTYQMNKKISPSYPHLIHKAAVLGGAL